jgi:hypothetical protein
MHIIDSEKQKILNGVLLNYYIVLDNQKKSKTNLQKHIYPERYGDALLALWYCLHLPRSGIDVISLNSSVINNANNLQHNIFIITSKQSEGELELLRNYPPTLFLSEDSCYEETCKLSVEYSSYLGCVNFSSLNSKLLSEQWGSLGKKVIELKADEQLLDVSPQLFSAKEISSLPITFLTNQTSDTNRVIEILDQHFNFSFKGRSYVTQRQIALFNVLERYSSRGTKPTLNKLMDEVEEARIVTGFPLIITLPGTPSSGGAYGLSRRDDEPTTTEKELIKFLGLQRAIARGGALLEGRPLNKSIFRRLFFLEEHFHEDTPKSRFVWESLRGFGRELKKHLGINNLQDYISGCSEIIAFTDFPIGLAILPGFSDPICSLVPISYRPLTPLTDTFRYGITRPPEHYIGAGRGLKVLIVECLDKDDRIRSSSDRGWRMVKDACERSNLIGVHYKEVESINELESILNDSVDIDILVISAHGQYEGKDFVGLSIGNQFWIPNNRLNVPPVIILSACHVAPKGRGAYTVSDAFLDAGALAVLGTLIPVNVRHNALFSQGFFLYIAEVLEGRVSCKNIAEVLPRIISSNAVYEILDTSEKLREWAYEKNGKDKSPIEEYYERLNTSFGDVHAQTISTLKEISKGTEMESYLDSILQSKGYISESFFYIFSGYPENIILEDNTIKAMIEDKFISFESSVK